MGLGWTIFGVVGALLLTGCSQTNAEVFGGCRLQAAQIYRDQSDPIDQSAAAEIVYFCMQSKGYVTTNDCPLKNGVVAQAALQCYQRIYFGK
jgi:hypothetical protein